jgi:hypothetical protein
VQNKRVTRTKTTARKAPVSRKNHNSTGPMAATLVPECGRSQEVAVGQVPPMAGSRTANGAERHFETFIKLAAMP